MLSGEKATTSIKNTFRAGQREGASRAKECQAQSILKGSEIRELKRCIES